MINDEWSCCCGLLFQYFLWGENPFVIVLVRPPVFAGIAGRHNSTKALVCSSDHGPVVPPAYQALSMDAIAHGAVSRHSPVWGWAHASSMVAKWCKPGCGTSWTKTSNVEIELNFARASCARSATHGRLHNTASMVAKHVTAEVKLAPKRIFVRGSNRKKFALERSSANKMWDKFRLYEYWVWSFLAWETHQPCCVNLVKLESLRTLLDEIVVRFEAWEPPNRIFLSFGFHVCCFMFHSFGTLLYFSAFFLLI